MVVALHSLRLRLSQFPEFHNVRAKMIESELLQKLASGASGSALGVWLAKITGWDRVVSGVGGIVCAHLATPVAVDYFRLMKYENITAFMLGLFSMLVVRKIYEAVESIDAKELAKAFVDKAKVLLGVKK